MAARAPPRCYPHVVYTSSDLNQCRRFPNSNATETHAAAQSDRRRKGWTLHQMRLVSHITLASCSAFFGTASKQQSASRLLNMALCRAQSADNGSSSIASQASVMLLL